MKNLSICGHKRAIRFFSAQIILMLFVFSAVKASVHRMQPKKDPDVIGRWDITIDKGGKSIPSWLEVQKSGSHWLIGRFVYSGGSARPISEVKVNDGKYSFSIPPQWEEGNRNMDFQFEVSGDKLTGTMVYTDGVTYNWTGVRAPKLVRDKAPVWGAPIRLFDGKNINGWHADADNQWIAQENGILRSLQKGS